MTRRILSTEEAVQLGWETEPGGALGPRCRCPVCRLLTSAILNDNSVSCSFCGWKPGNWPNTREEQKAFGQAIVESRCRSLGDVRSLFHQQRELRQNEARRSGELDEHQRTGIDAYAVHLGQQAARGLILAHETQWLEEYDRRRTHERKPVK